VRDELGEDTASSFDTRSERADINMVDTIIGTFTRENTTLDGGTVGKGFVRINPLGRPLGKIFLEELLNLGDTG
jgi:hypothetical protein